MPPSTSLRTGIACVHIPHFAVEVERQRRQGLTTRLILVGEATVFDCSLGAETSGVRRGMRMSEAIGLCHQAVVLPPDLSCYRHRFDTVLDFLNGYSPTVEACDPSTLRPFDKAQGRLRSGQGLGTAYLSLDGLSVDPKPFAEGIIASLHRRFGFMPSVGIAEGKFTARVAAQTTRPGLAKVAPSGEEAAFLAPLPVDHLAYGVAPAGDSMRRRLGLLGLETMGDIALLPLGAFQAQFGPEGKRCWELANGIDDEPLAPRVREETIVRRLEMPAPAISLEAILMGIERLVYAAYGDSGRKGRWACLSGRQVRKAVVRAALDGPDGQTGGSLRQAQGGAWELPVPFREALADPRDAWFAVKSAVERRPPQRPVEELEVELVGLSAESGKQAAMFDGKAKLKDQITETVRQLQAQHGQVALGKVVEVEPWSRIPERRAAMLEFDP